MTVPSAFETSREGDEPGAGSEQLLVLVEPNLPVVVDRDDLEHRARLRAELLPGHDVGVMLEPGDDDLVVLADVLAAPALRDEVDRLGCAADEDDLVRGRRVEKAADLFAGVLVGVGGAGGQLVRAAMDVRVFESCRNGTSRSMTACGFCVVAALSSQISGWPLICWSRMGKSRRTA